MSFRRAVDPPLFHIEGIDLRMQQTVEDGIGRVLCKQFLRFLVIDLKDKPFARGGVPGNLLRYGQQREHPEKNQFANCFQVPHFRRVVAWFRYG